MSTSDTPNAPKSGGAYVALADRGTDINAIPEEMWEASRIDVFEDEHFTYIGQRVVDGILCNVWWAYDADDAFVAQKASA